MPAAMRYHAFGSAGRFLRAPTTIAAAPEAATKQYKQSRQIPAGSTMIAAVTTTPTSRYYFHNDVIAPSA